MSFLGAIFKMNSGSEEDNHDPETEPENKYALRKSSNRVWHSTLRAITDMQTSIDEEANLKKTILACWRFYGDLAGLKERLDSSDEGAQTSPRNHGPSRLSKESRYWKIPKKCFWSACECHRKQLLFHSVRACKGCWRVLYCSESCQRA